MSHLIKQVRHFVLTEAGQNADAADVAAAAVEAAKGGHIVHLTIQPDGPALVVHPDHDHDTAHQAVRESLAKDTDAEQDSPATGTRRGRGKGSD